MMTGVGSALFNAIESKETGIYKKPLVVMIYYTATGSHSHSKIVSPKASGELTTLVFLMFNESFVRLWFNNNTKESPMLKA